MAKYSVVIHPSDAFIDEVKQMKALLASKIGWYNSKNSLAHLTLNEFERDESELKTIITKLTKIATYLNPQEVCFDSFATFPNGAFFLAPDAHSLVYLKKLLAAFHQKFPYPIQFKSSEPHISIGRRISPEKIAVAKALFAQNPPIRFTCNTIALRVFNTERKQFDICATFPLLGEASQEFIQGSLF